MISPVHSLLYSVYYPINSKHFSVLFISLVIFTVSPFSSPWSQVIDAARTLSSHPVSRIAQENMEVFVDVWETQVDELGKLLRGITAGGDVNKSKLMNPMFSMC